MRFKAIAFALASGAIAFGAVSCTDDETPKEPTKVTEDYGVYDDETYDYGDPEEPPEKSDPGQKPPEKQGLKGDDNKDGKVQEDESGWHCGTKDNPDCTNIQGN